MDKEAELERKRKYHETKKFDPTYRKQRSDYSKTYRTCPEVKKQKVQIQIAYERLKKYGITRDDYDKMLVNQNFSCAICQTHVSTLKRSLAVDHCHSTGKIRGLLCTNCNIGLGNFRDNTEYLRSASSYLNR